VLREACRQAREWQHAGLPFMRVSVNVSSTEFRHRDFVEGVRATLSETGLGACHLDLELTEGVLMDDAESTAPVLKELKTMGVHLAVDDFGTGYSSLSCQRRSNSGPPCTLIAEVKVTHPCFVFHRPSARRA
jgi:EAL domain-containing protein (putative c-di-GMP-specific phosphodiesterase class I)